MAPTDAQEDATRKKLRLLYNFLLYVSPVALLMVVFPVVTPELGRYRLGDVPLVHVILAASITVPWLSQAACMPIYRAIELEHKRVAKNRQELTERLETELKEGTVDKVRQLKALLKTPAYQRVSDVAAFARNWPYIYLTTLPLIILFALPLIFIMHWSASAVVSYLILSVLNLAFAQLLVLPSLAKNQVDWFFAWLGYAAALLFFPIFWFLPPTAGIIVLLLCLRKNIRQLKVFSRTPIIHVAQDALRGFLTGSVLWADKYVLFVAAHGQINVVAIYISLIPCVLAYNYFFVAEADRVNLVIKKLWSTFEEKPFAQVTNTAKEATHVSNYAMVRSLTVAIFGHYRADHARRHPARVPRRVRRHYCRRAVLGGYPVQLPDRIHGPVPYLSAYRCGAPGAGMHHLRHYAQRGRLLPPYPGGGHTRHYRLHLLPPRVGFAGALSLLASRARLVAFPLGTPHAKRL